MKMRLLYLVFLSFAALSCAGDLGNYDYHDLAEPEISGIDADLSVLTFSRLQLSPELGEREFPADRYDFEWKVIPEEGEQKMMVLGDTRELDYEVVLASGAYALFFTITEKTSGVYWQQRYHLQVNQATSAGWMVLCSDGGKTRLDMVSAVTSETYRNILANNGMPTLNGPRRIQALNPEGTDSDSPFYRLTDDGATRLGRNNFEWKEEYSLRYEMGSGVSPVPSVIIDLPSSKMMISGTEAYYADCSGFVGLYGSAVNKTFRVAPMIGSNIATSMIMVPVALLYDTDNKRFMGYSSSLAAEELGGLPPLQEMNELAKLADEMAASGTIAAGVTGKAFGDFPEGLDYVYMENTKYDPGNARMGVTYTVLADGDKRYIYGIQLGDVLTFGDCKSALGKAYYGDISECTKITQVTNLFAFSSLKNYMYYAVEGTVYRVDLSSQPLKAVPQFSLSGETITCLKFNIYRRNSNLSRSYDLVVGSMKGSEGLLRVYEGADSEGDFKSVKPLLYSGFAQIVDVAYREL